MLPMREITGDIWDLYRRGEWIVITTNGDINAKGEAVMGAGIARQAKQRIPDLPKRLGYAIEAYGNQVHVFHDLRIVTLPTKHHWRDEKADMELITKGALKLFFIFRSMNAPVFLVRPGVGCGKLAWADVKAVIAPILDDIFVVVEKKGAK